MPAVYNHGDRRLPTFLAVEPPVSRRSTAPLEAVVLPDLPPPRRNRWGVVLVGAAFIAVLGAIVGVIWGIGKLATSGRRPASDRHSLVDHWEEPEERLSNVSRAMNSRDVGASAAELRDFQRLFTRITNASRKDDNQAYLACFDVNLLVRRISQHPAVRSDRNFSTWQLKSDIQAGLETPGDVGEFSVVRVERGERDDLALVYAVDWSPGVTTTAYRWWLARSGRNWRVFDWERLDYQQPLAHTWAVRDAVDNDPHSYNYTVLRGAVDSEPSDMGGRTWGSPSPGSTDLASLIDDPLPEVIHDAAMLDLGWALVGQDRPVDAIRACNALRRPQDHPGYLIVRSRAYAALGRDAEALADARKYQELAGRDPLALEQEADSLARLDRHAQAAECWRQMLHLAPNHAEALNNFCRLAEPAQRASIGEILRATRQPVEAAVNQAQNAIYEDDLELFQQFARFVNEAAPGAPAAVALGARRLEHEGQHEQAAAEFKRAAEAEFRPDKKLQYFNEFLSAMAAAGKVAAGYAAASDPQAAFDYLTTGYEYEESSLTDEQLKVLLAEHERRVPGDARADYLAGQLLLEAEDYAAADAKFQSAMTKADEETRNYYRGGRIEALYHLGRWSETYDSMGRTPEVFRDLARHCESDGAWDELRALIQRHRTHHSADRWIDYYEAKIHQQRGESGLALAAILRAEQGDEQLKMFCRWIKRPLLIEAGQLHQAFVSPDDRREEFLGLALELTNTQNWARLDELYLAQSPLLGSDADVLNAWTSALWQQDRLADAAEALGGDRTFDRPAGRRVHEELAERHVRCLLRLDRRAEARQAAERASTELGHQTPLVMVLLAEGNMATVRERLADPAVQRPLLAQAIDQDPELVQLLLHPDLADLRGKLALLLLNHEREFKSRLILLLREPIEPTEADLAERLARIGASGASIGAVVQLPGEQRRSFRVEHEKNSLLVTFGSAPYWKRTKHNLPPREPALARILDEHRGYVVLECDRSELAARQKSDAMLLCLLATDFCDDRVLAIHGRRGESSDWRLVASDPARIAELRRGQFLSDAPRAGESFSLIDALRYPDQNNDDTASAEETVRRRAAIQLARRVQAGQPTEAQVRVELWSGHARESAWLSVVSAKKDEYGRFELHGERPADSVLRPHLRRGSRLAVEPYEVLEIREPKTD